MVNVNMTAVLVAVVVNFILGVAWYMPLFGKVWGKEMGFDMSEKPSPSVMYKGMAFMVIGNFFFAWVLAHNIAAWDFVPGIKEMGVVGSTLSTAIFTYLGFYFPGQLSATVWERKSWKLFAIDAGYSLVSLLVVSTILTHWK